MKSESGFSLAIASQPLQITNYKLQITNYKITNYKLQKEQILHSLLNWPKTTDKDHITSCNEKKWMTITNYREQIQKKNV